jgi:MerR family copper efflux transcriptional regulator
MLISLRLNVDMTSSGCASGMSIGEAAGRFGLPTHVLRHWESVGLLVPDRTPAGRRRYGLDHLHRIAAILRAKEAGFRLDDIREIIEADGATRRALMRRHRTDLAQRIALSQASLRLIDAALACEHDDFTRCPAFRSTFAALAGGPASVGEPGLHHACTA